MLIAALALGGLGLLAAVGLGVAAMLFRVEVDPLVASIEEALPGANCGGCGFAGCAAAAEAIAAGKMSPSGCVGGSEENRAAVAAILGVVLEVREPEIAKVGCRYPVAKADLKFSYDGVEDCRAAFVVGQGPKECPIGCIGLGSCVKACPFGALMMGEDGLPKVLEHLCTGCGTCVRTCPMGIMRLTSVTNRILGEYTSENCSAPCERACPAGINIPEQLRLTARGDFIGALRVIKERNPLPSVCGRICYHPCEFDCRRNLAADEPLAINYLKRFVADLERSSEQKLEMYRAPATGRKVAIVGGGAEGLSAAYYLARLGHSPSVHEAQKELGGLLRTVIPESRLPRTVLDYDIQAILDLGVKALTGQVLGRDFTLGSLFGQGYGAVFLATGGWDSLLQRGLKSGLEEAVPGVRLLLPLTLSWMSGQKPVLGKRVVLVGGGEAALDAGQRLQADGHEATVLFRRARPDLPVRDDVLDQVRAAGVWVEFGATVSRLQGRGDRLERLFFRKLDPSLLDQTEHAVEAEAVVAASGRLPEAMFVPRPEEKAAEIAWETASPYPGPATARHRGLFGSASAASDYMAVIEAIGSGRRAAASLHQAVSGRAVAAPRRMITPENSALNVSRLENLLPVGPRQKMPLLQPAQGPEVKLDPKAEMELGISQEQAVEEAKRCLNCGLICYLRSKYH